MGLSWSRFAQARCPPSGEGSDFSRNRARCESFWNTVGLTILSNKKPNARSHGPLPLEESTGNRRVLQVSRAASPAPGAAPFLHPFGRFEPFSSSTTHQEKPMILFSTLPDEVVAVFGHPGAEKFVDYLNSSISLQSSAKRTFLPCQPRNSRTGWSGRRRAYGWRWQSFAPKHAPIAEVHTEIARRDEGGFRECAQRDRGLHGQISAPTRWLLGGLAAAVTLYPLITKLVGRLIP